MNARAKSKNPAARILGFLSEAGSRFPLKSPDLQFRAISAARILGFLWEAGSRFPLYSPDLQFRAMANAICQKPFAPEAQNFRTAVLDIKEGPCPGDGSSQLLG